MKQWISRFRTQRLTGEGRRRSHTAAQGLGSPVFRLLIGGALWAVTCALLYAGNKEPVGDFMEALGLAQREFLLLIVTAIAAGLLKVLEPSLFRDTTKLLLLAMCGLLSIVPADSLLYLHQIVPGWSHSTVEFLIPLTLAPLLAGVLLGSAAATVTGLWVSCVCAVLFDNNVTVLATGLITTATAASLAPRARRRTQVIRIGLIAGLSEVAGVAALTGIHPLALSELAHQSIGCAIDGIASALVVVTILPIFETLFGVTTRITLMELSDLGHPLLQRLAFEAPGTYHHSLMVANLAQAAADSVGADAVLARAGAYFHDIGKLTKPAFFSENIQGVNNPHDTLAPSMSALIVMAHVKEGLSLAMLYRLPKAVLDIIEQHHGTGLAAYFHHKAGRQTPTDGLGNEVKSRRVAVDESSYRYSGPRPLSREATIIMLADAVEAASRSMEKPSPSHICDLVDHLVETRFEDSQLDVSCMTLAELACVRRAFVLCLTNMLHSRVAYPRS